MLPMDQAENKHLDAMLEEAWSSYHAYNKYQKTLFLACVTLQQDYRQPDSSTHQLPQAILKIIINYVQTLITNLPAKMLELSANAFLEYLEKHPIKITHGLEEELADVLEIKNLTERAVKINRAVMRFTDNEFGEVPKGEYKKSPITALLCKFHLLQESEIKRDPNNFECFQEAERQIKRMKR